MDPQLLRAVRSGDRREFWSLVEGNIELLSATTPQGNTVLHLSLLYCHAQLAEEISRHPSGYPLLRKVNNKKETPLHYAAASSSPQVLGFAEAELRRLGERNEVLELLMAKDDEGNTPLITAAAGGHAQLVRSILRIRGELSMDVNDAGESALYVAAVGGWRNAVDVLLEFPFSPGNKGPRCRSILHAAVRNSDLRMAFDIVGRMGVSTIEEADVSGCTPLHYAVSYALTELVDRLLERGSSAAYTLNKNGRSPLHDAVEMGHIEIVRLIVKHCRDSMEVLDSKGKNALHIAAEKGYSRIVGRILRETCNEKLINQRDTDGNTPLHLAFINYRIFSLGALLEDPRVNLYVENNAGQTFIDAATPTTAISFTEIIILFGSFWVFNMGRTRLEAKIRALDASARPLFKQTAKKMSVVAILITTATFSAGLTVPGIVRSCVPKGATAKEVLSTPALENFMRFDILAFVLSVLYVASTYTMFENTNAAILLLLYAYLTLSLISMVLAFGFGLVVVLSPCNSSPVFILPTYASILLSVSVLVLSALPIYVVMWGKHYRIYKQRLGR